LAEPVSLNRLQDVVDTKESVIEKMDADLAAKETQAETLTER
jgi:hypothetical protein